ncbi:MAG TPA: acyl-[ACP]--phospholipid O-acyltransferase [Candidatus Angelobacter sp.]|jgi:acyl-[acyl-carrier-protein]-phospholipid O-acyltransferase/long-chain-fatty-acid--[acyl-carrier-protein] ligase|nr:acyl-[ACP]--phospholipid O-acyltransferase [Candidatus Angelobacter sp.]
MPHAVESSQRETADSDHPVNAALPSPVVEESQWRRGFWSLIVTQFQGAFSANAFRYLLTYMILGMALPRLSRDKLVAMVGLLFSVPFVLFSMAGGFLADRFSKRHVTIATKIIEIAAMALAVVALQTQALAFQFAVLFLVVTQAALFGPSKYGLLPEILPPKRLSWGNGVIELGTFLAVIAGTMAGGWLSELFQKREAYVGGILAALAVVGLLFSLGISRVPAAAPHKKFRMNFVVDLIGQIKQMRQDRPLFLAVIGNIYFWFLGALYLPTVIVYGRDLLHLQPTKNSLLDVALALGIGIGSLVAGYLSDNKIEYGLIPLGSIGMTIMAAAAGIFPHSFVSVAGVFFGLGFFAGFFVVPVNTLIQHRPAADSKGGILAAANLLTFVGVAAASGVYFLLTNVGHLNARGVFLATSIITLFGTIYVLFLLPNWFLRLLLWFVVHTVYRVRILGRDNVPEKGGALFVSNHMSFVDVLLLMASTDRPIRFLMLKDIYDRSFIKPFARIMGAIPVSSELRPRDMIVSLRTASDAIRNGEIVCIFAEGQITRTGQMLPFRRGLERIMKGVDAPIVPVNLHGVWGSIFSFERNRFLWKLPQRLPYPVTVSFGAWLPAAATATDVRRAVQELQTTAFITDPQTRTILDKEFVRCARRNPLHFAIGDARVPKMRFGGMLVKSIYVARRLREVWKDQEMVGVLLPPSVGGALVNIAAALLGKVVVNLNYTASNETIASCARQCNLQTVITAKAFVERFPKMEIPGRTILLEDALAQPRSPEKLAALAFAWLLPYRLLKRALGGPVRNADDLATVIFSSGSTGEPKGVMLTHYNIFSNIRQMAQVFLLRKDDRFLGILPFFHSFGFTATLWLPAIYGVGVVFHANPLDATVISELAGKYRATFLIATPTFLQAYMRRCSPEDFGSLRFVIVGAEKLQERVALAFEDTFGIRPIEGYGCTECSPVVAVNTRDYRAPGIRQVGARRGTVGHPLPGISVRIVDPETLEPILGNEPGMLQVKGPNVMKGYLGQPDKTAEVLKDGWYTTGDIVAIEDGGFLVITDRLSRFSKIGGEMVPHIKIEEKLHELIETAEQVFAVSSVPDEKRGERLVVLHTLSPEKLAPVLEKLAQSDLPALWKPRPNQFFHVEVLPYLGSGKLDLSRLKALAGHISETVAVG